MHLILPDLDTYDHRCTCCANRLGRVDPGRPVYYDDGADEWCHLDLGPDEAWSSATVLHAHVDTGSVDCDGPLDRSWVAHAGTTVVNDHLPEGDERRWITPAGPSDFFTSLLRMAAGGGLGGTLSWECPYYGDVTEWRIEWGYGTEEGHAGGSARLCDLPDCAHERERRRDYFAEAMGY